MARIIMSAKFVSVLQIDTEFGSYLIRDGQPLSVVLKDGRLVGGTLVGKNEKEKCIVIEVYISKKNVVVELEQISFIS